MKSLFRAIGYSSVGVFFAGIISVLAGCTEREGVLGLLLLILLQFCSGPVAEEGVPLGTISDTPVSLDQFAASIGFDPRIIQVGSGVYAIFYLEGGTVDGKVTTVSIDAAGNVGAIIDTDTFDTSVIGITMAPSVIQAAPGVYAVVYQDVATTFLITLGIDTAGNIGTIPIDTQTIDTNAGGSDTAIIQVGPGIFAIAYEGADQDGFIDTYPIDGAGNIGALVDSLEYDPAFGATPELIQVGPGMYAIAYAGAGFDGFVATVDIDAVGIIGSVQDSLEYDPGFGARADVIQVGPDVYAIAYNGSGNDGVLTTVRIDAAGNIGNAIIDTLIYDNIGTRPTILPLSGGVYVISYQSQTDVGVVFTVPISTAGIIGSIIDTLQFAPTPIASLHMVRVGANTYAIVYQSNTGEGTIITIRID